MSTDLLGRDLTDAEQRLLAAYDAVKALAADDTLAPCVTANTRHALAALAQAVTDLGLRFEHLLDLDV